jgi:S1-C subfamily serine protease
MSDQELSPKAPRLRRDDAPPRTAFDAGSFFPFLDDSAPPAAALQLEQQPTARDLMVCVPSPSPDDVILDPATPRTPTHQRAELQMTTGTAAQVLKKHMDAVVKVHTTHSRPNWELPWQRRQQTHSKSTGFCVVAAGEPRWILTNAHSVCYASQVQLKRRGDDERHEAKV